jgi:hypothetical protein
MLLKYSSKEIQKIDSNLPLHVSDLHVTTTARLPFTCTKTNSNLLLAIFIYSPEYFLFLKFCIYENDSAILFDRFFFLFMVVCSLIILSVCLRGVKMMIIMWLTRK